MDVIFGGLAFAGLIAAQFLAVIALHRERVRDAEHPSSPEIPSQPVSTAPRWSLRYHTFSDG